MNKTITKAHPETREILINARKAWENKEITQEQYNQIVLSCFKAEQERALDPRRYGLKG